MEKEGITSIFSSQEGKIKVALLYYIVLMFVIFLWSVNALTITINTPTNYTYNESRNVNFTFTPVWSNSGENASNCSVWVNATGVWQSVVSLEPANITGKVANGST